MQQLTIVNERARDYNHATTPAALDDTLPAWTVSVSSSVPDCLCLI